MKIYMLVTSIMLLVACEAKKDTQHEVVDCLKTKNVDALLEHCDLPFNYSAGLGSDDANVTTKVALKAKFKEMFKGDYINEFFRENKITYSGNKVNIEVHSYNADGEMESESALILHFHEKDGQLKLYWMMLAG